MAFIDSASDPRYKKCAVVISQDSYTQSLESERVPAMIINEQVTSWRWIHANLNTTETVTEYRGLTEAFAKTFTDCSATRVIPGNGSFQYESYSKKTSCRRANEAGGWTVTVTEKNTTISTY